MFFLHAGDTEVGGFAISAQHDPLYIEDFVTVRQVTSWATVEFDDEAVADHFDQCVDAGMQPGRFARIWCHTHPGESPEPSLTDEETFDRVFGSCDWAIMFIVGRTGRTYARLRFNAGPGGQVILDVCVDWAAWPKLVLDATEQWEQRLLSWAEEFDQNVRPAPSTTQLADNSWQSDQGFWDFEEYDIAGWRPEEAAAAAAVPVRIQAADHRGNGEVPA